MNTLGCFSVPSLATLGVVASVLPGVSALSETAPIIAAGVVACFMLLIVITVIVYAVSSNSWVKSSMKSEGKVKMPRSYWERKREAKRKLIQKRLLANQSVRSSRGTQDTFVRSVPSVNGSLAPTMPPALDKETMVQGWSRDTRKIYEEKGYTMELGEENEEEVTMGRDEEFQIETTIVDNEVLDVGPYQSVAIGDAEPVDGNVYAKPYIYSNKDKVVSRSTDANGGMVSTVFDPDVFPSTVKPTDSEFTIEDKLIRL